MKKKAKGWESGEPETPIKRFKVGDICKIISHHIFIGRKCKIDCSSRETYLVDILTDDLKLDLTMSGGGCEVSDEQLERG